jgi:hypothetical protein
MPSAGIVREGTKSGFWVLFMVALLDSLLALYI